MCEVLEAIWGGRIGVWRLILFGVRWAMAHIGFDVATYPHEYAGSILDFAVSVYGNIRVTRQQENPVGVQMILAPPSQIYGVFHGPVFQPNADFGAIRRKIPGVARGPRITSRLGEI